jgi:hypothetical protein
MLDDKNNEMKITIGQDKILDMLMHAATQEDIARLDRKINALHIATREDINRLNSKMDKLIFGVILAILVPITLQFLHH